MLLCLSLLVLVENFFWQISHLNSLEESIANIQNRVVENILTKLYLLHTVLCFPMPKEYYVFSKTQNPVFMYYLSLTVGTFISAIS